MSDTDGSTIGATLARPHVWRDGTASHPLLLLHGTGADENDLLPLGEALAPGAPLLSPRGMVLEGSMPRFFRRLDEGVFDEDDLRTRTDELADFVTAASDKYGVTHGSLVAVGFSNGANTASALLIRRPDLVRAAVLIAAMVPYRSGIGEADLTGTRVAIVNGDTDPTVPADHTARLAAQLRAAGTDVTMLSHNGGHIVPTALIPDIRKFIAATTEPEAR